MIHAPGPPFPSWLQPGAPALGAHSGLETGLQTCVELVSWESSRAALSWLMASLCLCAMRGLEMQIGPERDRAIDHGRRTLGRSINS